MKKIWIALGLVFLLAIMPLKASAVITPAATAPRIVIDDDMGGSLFAYVRWIKRIQQSGVPVTIHGLCISACTIVLMLPKEQLCAERTASFAFHLVSHGGDDDGDRPMTRAVIARYYPEALKKWLQDKKLSLKEMIWMSAEKAAGLGIVRLCDQTLAKGVPARAG